MNVLHSSQSSQWFTPPWLVEKIREALGGVIDLDPASCELAQTIVKAEHYFADGALERPWVRPVNYEAPNSVFLNPPYLKTDGGCMAWAKKACTEWNGRYPMILLLNATPDRRWFQYLVDRGATVCFLRKRVRFLRPGSDGIIQGPSPTHGSVLFYLGPNPDLFTRVFRDEMNMRSA